MRLRIQNFKSYSDTGFLDLKPLTLIFGKNSAGKSAVIQALNSLSTSNLVRPIREGFLDPQRSKCQLSFYGETWDLGDFSRVVHKRDLGSDLGFEFGLKLIGEEMRGVYRDLRAKKLNNLKAQLHELKEQRGIPFSIKMQFSNPGRLRQLSITSLNGIAIGSFVRTSMSARSPALVPKDDPEVYGPMVMGILRDNRKLAEFFAKEIQKIWFELNKLNNSPIPDAESNYNNPASIRWEKTKLRRRAEWLTSLEDIQWIMKFDGPEDFLERCSEQQFIEFLGSEPMSRRESQALDRIDRQLYRQLMEEWELPKLDLRLEPLPIEFSKAVTLHNRKARAASGFIIDRENSDLFLIDHRFVVDCFKNIPNKQQADYWSRKLDGIRLLVVLSSSPYIFPIDVTSDTPQFLSDDPVSEYLRGWNHEFNSVSFLAGIISKAFDTLRDELRSIKHVPAFRGNPRRTIDRDSRDEIAKSLDRLTKVELKKLNSALKLIGWSQDFDLIIESESGENRKIPRLTDFSKNSGRKKKNFETLADVGFGFSQLFPIVENAISDKPQSFLVEEPEVHLHPSLQGDLIELIARNSLACTEIPFAKESSDSPLGNKHKWFIETHSEYMLRRVQKLIAKGLIDSKQVAVYFCDIDDQGERLIREIKLGSKGQMLTPWPNDFIETGLEAQGARDVANDQPEPDRD